MAKIYSDSHSLLSLIPFDLAVLLANVLRGTPIDGLAIQVLVQLALFIPLHIYANRPLARLESDRLLLLSGVGMHDPDEIPIGSIVSVDRVTRRFLNIRTDNRTISIEATPSALDELEQDLHDRLLPGPTESQTGQ